MEIGRCERQEKDGEREGGGKRGRGRNSLVLSSRMPPGKKQSGERSRISWASSLKVVGTDEIARSVIIS